jgi:hypothetical protein
MAVQFPNSIKSWTPLEDNTSPLVVGQINTIYEEVNAIETKLKAGTNGQYLGIVDNVPTWSTVSGVDVNVETLTVAKNLTTSDKIYQLFNVTANIDVNLPAGDATRSVFYIKNTSNSATYGLTVKYGATTLTVLYGNGNHQIGTFLWNGTLWTMGNNEANSIQIGYGAKAGTGNISIGKNSSAVDTDSISVGINATGGINHTSIGNGAVNNSWGYGVSLGTGANSASGGYGAIAVGQGTNCSLGLAIGRAATTNSKLAQVFGYFARAERYGEVHFKFDYVNSANNRYTYSILDWQGSTSDNTVTEIFLTGASNQRATILAASIALFEISITAMSTTYEVMTWKITGSIRRDASNVTSIVGTPTITEIANSGTLVWAVAVSADDTNESLKLTVTGETGKTIKWNAIGQINDLKI